MKGRLMRVRPSAWLPDVTIVSTVVLTNPQSTTPPRFIPDPPHLLQNGYLRTPPAFAQQHSGLWVDLLGKEAGVVRIRAKVFEHPCRRVNLAGQRQALHRPKAADTE